MIELDPAVQSLMSLYEADDLPAVLRAWDELSSRVGTMSSSSRARARGAAGLAMVRVGRQDEALEHLAASFELDPTDRDVAAGLGQLYLQRGQRAEAARAFEMLLTNHRDGLTTNSLRTVLTHLAAWYVECDQLDRARIRLEEALDLDPSHPLTLRPLVELYDRLGLVGEAGELRLRLVEKLPDGTEKAGLCQTQARVLLAAGRRLEAVDWLLTAWKSEPTAGLAVEISDLLVENGRYAEAAHVLRLAVHSSGTHERRDLAVRRAQILEHRLNQPLEAAHVLDSLLDAAPDDLETFERVVALLAQSAAWTELHDAYARMIARLLSLDPRPNRVLARLWRNLGELNQRWLHDDAGALTALFEASQLEPEAATDEAIVALAAHVEDPSMTIAPLRAVWQRQSADVAAAEQLAAAYIRTGATDQGYLVLNTVDALGGELTPSARQTLQRIQAARRWKFQSPLHAGLREKYLNPAATMTGLRTVLGIAWQLTGDLFARALDEYDLSTRDALDPNKPLLLTRVWQETLRNLGHETPVALFPYAGVETSACAFTHRPAVLVNPRYLSAEDDRELRFVVGRQLALMENECMLAVLLPRTDLSTVLACMIHAVRPSFEVPGSELGARVQRTLSRTLNDAWRRPLELAVASLFTDETAADLDRWLLGMAIEVNRSGLVCSDAPGVAVRMSVQSQVFASRVDGEAVGQAVLDFAAADVHHELRRRVGIHAGA